LLIFPHGSGIITVSVNTTVPLGSL